MTLWRLWPVRAAASAAADSPIHDGQEFAEKRAPVLYAIDKKKPIRFSHENPEVNRLYETYLEKPCSPKSHHLLHVEHKI